MDYRSPAFPYQGVLPCKTEISTHAHGVVCSCEMKQSVTATEHLTSPRGADSPLLSRLTFPYHVLVAESPPLTAR